MKLYNTLTKQIEEIAPLKPPEVTVYTCGPTVYDYPHIGNWFTFIRYDLLVRTLRASGLKPKWVMNITDVGHLTSDADEGEDKLEKGARREHKSAWDVADYYADYFVKGLDRLNISPPDFLPKATDHIAEQVALIKTLEDKGYTYVIDDGVYYDTSKFGSYADFARLDLDELQAGARVEHNPQKKNASDFALWKFSPAGSKRDMEWWAPWQTPGEATDEKRPSGLARDKNSIGVQGAGEQRTEPYNVHDEGAAETVTPQSAGSTAGVVGLAGQQSAAVRGSWGFPGWHIECSVMSMKYLGPTLDIHSGGIDHIPVHHSNEIAQSEAATGKKFASVWMHTNHILVDDDKISKSLGNGLTLEDIEKQGYDLDTFRLFVLESHYRSQSKFSWDGLGAAKNRLNDLRAMAVLRWQPVETNDKDSFSFGDAADQLLSIMSEDLASPAALAYLSEVSRQVLATLIHPSLEEQFELLIGAIDNLLGMRLGDVPDISDDQKALIAEREAARHNKDWAKSDELRNQLAQSGIGLSDRDDVGTIWRYL